VEKLLWKGTLELGELVVPVGLATAVRDPETGLRQIHAACGSPIRMLPYCEVDEDLLEPEEIALAFEIAPGGSFQAPLPDDLSAIKEPDSRRIPIGCFTPSASIDPRLVKKHYHLLPSSPVGLDAYVLLRSAIADLDVAAIVRFNWRGDKVAAIESRDGLLDLAVLYFHEDLAEAKPADLADRLGVKTRPVSDELLELARELVHRHTRRLVPEKDLVGLEQPRLLELRERLLAGEPFIRPTVKKDERAARPIADLEGALRRSVKQAPRRHKARARVPVAG